KRERALKSYSEALREILSESKTLKRSERGSLPRLSPSREKKLTVLIDSWSWIEYWKGSRYAEKAAEYIEGSDTAVLSTVKLAEIYFSVLRDYDEKKAREKADTVRKRCFLIPVDEQIA